MGIRDYFKKSDSKTPPPMGPQKPLIMEALGTVMDPDLHKDIVSLHFVKEVNIEGNNVSLIIELTTPACPAKDMLHAEIKEKVSSLPGVQEVDIQFTARIRHHRPQLTADTQAALGGVKNVIAIASGKGGVGKSTTTLHLAYALAKTGSTVGILDADIHGPSMAHMTGAPKPEQTQGKLIVPPEVNGVRVISVAQFNPPDHANIMRGPMAAQVIRQFLTQIAWGELDYLLIDYPPGTGDIQLSLSQLVPLSGAVMVTTPGELALLDVRKALTMFNTTKIPLLGIIENMSYFVCDGCDKKHFIFSQGGGERLADHHGVPILAQIPIDTRMGETHNNGQLGLDGTGYDQFSLAAGKMAAQLSILNMNEDQALKSFSLEWKSHETQ